MRSRYQALPTIVTSTPATVDGRSNTTSSYASTTSPTAETALATLGTWVRNCPGSATALRSAYTRSPSTALDAQLRVERGAGKNSGLTTTQASASAIGTRLY